MVLVDILMATYNGAQFIESQILSIIGQKFKNWHLFVHDDGSTDNTLDIARKMSSLDSRITVINDSYIAKNAGMHFMYMLRFSEAPYTCFCDQDDIWFENKLSVMYKVIEERNSNIPQVVFSDAYLYYSDLNNVSRHLLYARPHTLKELLFINGGIHGSASLFNEKMRICINRQYDIIAMHDHILTLAGCCFGEITYINQKLFLYRQHANNVTGNMPTNIWDRIKRGLFLHQNSYVLSMLTINSLRSFFEIHKEALKESDKSLICSYFSLLSASPFIRFWKIILARYTLAGSRYHLWIKILTRNFFDVIR